MQHVTTSMSIAGFFNDAGVRQAKALPTIKPEGDDWVLAGMAAGNADVFFTWIRHEPLLKNAALSPEAERGFQKLATITITLERAISVVASATEMLKRINDAEEK